MFQITAVGSFIGADTLTLTLPDRETGELVSREAVVVKMVSRVEESWVEVDADGNETPRTRNSPSLLGMMFIEGDAQGMFDKIATAFDEGELVMGELVAMSGTNAIPRSFTTADGLEANGLLIGGIPSQFKWNLMRNHLVMVSATGNLGQTLEPRENRNNGNVFTPINLATSQRDGRDDNGMTKWETLWLSAVVNGDQFAEMVDRMNMDPEDGRAQSGTTWGIQGTALSIRNYRGKNGMGLDFALGGNLGTEPISRRIKPREVDEDGNPIRGEERGETEIDPFAGENAFD
ncbi:MAG: hypothetical protein AAF125_02660 [Chloroflexota bacterium]